MNANKLEQKTKMNAIELKKAIGRKPFRPFSIYMSDGDVIDVERAEWAVVHPRKQKTMIVFEADGGFRILDLHLISQIRAA